MRIKVVMASLMVLTFLQGCAGRAWNAPGPSPATTPVAAASEPLAVRGDDDVFIVLAFSGGGTGSVADFVS
ncbi:MAG TPA: hypothetical protein VIE47_10170 [Methylocystis sp.]